ncbi:sulfatase-like hydrolase/transferase [Anatilimnocola floriformis]|uniref:sulfatase-like hydrolase/transferase n=1 Tax=Anatilimnocola floriformis TaxID=2948575 RepID=UPI0020C51158|nr:sulfatase-like hydrolase/transferase [Anatilimnocola floriformis]
MLILADDLGYGDLGCYGHPLIKTPNLDAFARQGVQLTQCYAASGVCSPSRSAILTGRTPYRNGVFTWIPENREIHLRTSELTLPKLLKEVGYETCHVGKWHLNSHFNQPTQPQPNDHGYDYWLATQNNAAPSHENPTNFVRNGKPVGKIEGYSSHIIVDEAALWLKEKRNKDKPFLLCVWAHEPHYPIKAAAEYKAQYPDLTDEMQKEHHANVTQLDAAFGKLLKTLDDLKLTDETFVMFTSDNGPEGDGVKTPGRGSTGGLRGRKRAVYEGGIRVPGIVRLPKDMKGVEATAGTKSSVPVIGSDIFVTAAKLAGAKLPTDRVLDGGDFLPALEQKPVKRDRPLYWRCVIAPTPMKTAMRIGDWKIVANEPLTKFELYNLSEDSKEENDLASKEPAKFAEMQAELKKLNAEIEAEGPTWWKTYQNEGQNKKQPAKRTED